MTRTLIALLVICHSATIFAENENLVDKSLRYFATTQSDNGSWIVEDPNLSSAEWPLVDQNEATTAASGLVVLTFLGAGYDHKTPNRFRKVVKRGLEFLVSNQQADGLFAPHVWTHALATLAVSEAYAMTNDPALRPVGQSAVDNLLHAQLRDSQGRARAWGVNNSAAEWHLWSTALTVMALRSARAGGLTVSNDRIDNSGMDGARQWLHEQLADGDRPLGVSPGSNEARVGPVGLMMVFAGMRVGDELLDQRAAAITVESPQFAAAMPNRAAEIWMATLCQFQYGGDEWLAWD